MNPMRKTLTLLRKYVFALLAVLAAVVSIGIACKTSPAGRNQLILLDDAEMNRMGEEAFAEIKSQTPIENNPVINAYVRCIVNTLLTVTNDSTGVTSWEVVVFRDETANAFALPGGKVGVHTGILPVARTADQLAAVLGHEIGHVIARHGNERVSQATAGQTVLGAVGSVVEDETIMGAIGAGAQFGVLLPFSREHESEADIIGQELMAQAGFDPTASVTLWMNMAQNSSGAPPEIMSTHPSHDTRISDLRGHLQKTIPMYQAAIATRGRPNCHL